MPIKKEKKVFEKNILLGFDGGTVAKNLSANAGNVDLIPGPGRSHMLRSNLARAPGLLSLCSQAWGSND